MSVQVIMSGTLKAIQEAKRKAEAEKAAAEEAERQARIAANKPVSRCLASTTASS